MSSLIVEANRVLLEASRQAGFLAAAVLAASAFLGPQLGDKPSSTWVLLPLVLSMVCSICAHLAVGHSMIRLIRNPNVSPTKQAEPNLIWPAWRLGIAQAVFLVAALSYLAVGIGRG